MQAEFSPHYKGSEFEKQMQKCVQGFERKDLSIGLASSLKLDVNIFGRRIYPDELGKLEEN